MLKNYIKIAIRSFSRQKGFSMINILGLASGMAICMLIITLIKDQNDYDQFHTKKDRIYRIISDRTSDHSSTFATAPFPLYDEVVGKEATVEKALRIENWFSGDALYDEKTNSIEGIYAEATFFDFFDFDLIYGDERTALEEPFSILLTEEASKLYDLPENPVGEVLQFKDLGPFTIKGIIKTPEQKTHVNFNQAIVSFSSLRPLDQAGKVRSTLDDWKGTDYSLIYPLLIAILIATPGAWYLNDLLWLNDFANRINWNFFNLGFGVCLIGLISLTIIFSQAYRIARQNPVESLRID